VPLSLSEQSWLPPPPSSGANDILVKMKKYLSQLAAIVVAMCGSAYILITLSGATRRQALWITGVMLAAVVLTAYFDVKGDDE